MSITQRRSLLLAALLCSAGFGQSTLAATPSTGTITPTSGAIDYTAGPFVVANPTPVLLLDTAPQCGGFLLPAPAQPCDSYALTVTVPSGYRAQYPSASVRVSLSWEGNAAVLSDADYDLWIFEGEVSTTDGTETADASSASAGNPEVTAFPVKEGSQVYTIKVVPYTPTGESIAVHAEFVPGPEAEVGGGGGGGSGGGDGGTLPTAFGGADGPSVVAPRFQTFYAPAGSTAESDGGEYSIGFNPASGRIMTMSIGFPGPVWRLTPPEILPTPEPESCEALWEDKSSLWASVPQVVSDPILWTDQDTGRTWAANLTVGPNISYAFTDDDGENWINIGTGIAGADHETVVSGPYPAGSAFELIARTAGFTGKDGKGRATYFCSQDVVGPGGCTRSDDGGLIWQPPSVAYTGQTCGGLHGHLHVGLDGTAYLPLKDCGSEQGGSFSTNAGVTWTEFTVPGTAPQTDGSDPSIAIDDANTLYFCYVHSDGHAHVKVGHRDGSELVWGKDTDLGAAHGVKNASFPEAIGGDPGRAACGFLGTDNPSVNYQSLAFEGVWYLFIATTYDGGETWTTVNATPNDPVQGHGGIWQQGGSAVNRNLLDFNEVTMDDKGRVLFGYNDGCVTQSCISDPSNNDFVAHQRVARQTGGKTLRAAYDNEFATAKAPGRACLAAASTSSGVNLTWKTPDHGGSAISSYTVVKQPVAGGSPTLIPVSKTSYLDSGANAADFVYSVKASNATGTGLASNAIGASGSVEEPEDVCTVPGVTVASDAEGDDNPPLPTAMAGQGDILSLKVSEPRGVDDKLVFTLKVASLESLPPNVNWYVNFLDPAGKKWFVSMQTDETSTASFNYGDYSAAQSGISQTIGDADASSGYTAETGEIKLVIAKSLVGGATAGQTLTQVQATTYQLVGLSQVGGSLQTIDSSATGSYTLRAAAACSVNTAPKATLAASTQMGEIPLPVRFTVGVSDVDAGDTLHYTLNFGDGSSPATGTTSGTVDHTYSAVGDYVATLTVTDAAGATDVAPVQIKAQDSGSTGESNEIVATLSANKTGGEAPIEITFNAAGSKYADGSALRSPGYTFVFGDGTNSGVLSSATTSHNYTAAGTYRAYVMVTDEDGNVDSSDPVTIETTVTITVGDDTGTVAQLTVDNASGPAPLTVTFDGSRSIAATGRTITNYTFDFDDGTPVKSGTAASVTHTYTVPGSYHPKLTVTDSEGTQSEAKADVGVVTPGTGGGGGGSNGGSNKKGGAMGWLTLLPFVGVALLRRRRQR